MSSVKTAISLDDHLLKRVDHLAENMQVSRSRVFVLALEEFIQKLENQRFLSQINMAYADEQEQEQESQSISKGMKRQQRELLM